MYGHPICLDAPIHLDAHCTYTTQRKNALSHYGMSICPIHLDAPYVWMAPCMVECPHMCGHPLYVWMPPMFGCYLYVWMPPCVWTSSVCLYNVWMPPVHTQHKESMLCHTKGVSICPHTFGCPSCLDTPICLDVPHMFQHPAVCLDVHCTYTTQRKHALSH